ncbi:MULTISPECIES: RICIN domain-containing protein [unclassified Streptomyces]|uniref:RICIN domain-containing protein n=1 Tax=unclassified Streptomyces TaxID=2593676 RepID=UPI0004BD6274|nr:MULTISPECIES: ricin-type beta-trefoil lectin domain protein [unclassified Streptomyces]
MTEQQLCDAIRAADPTAPFAESELRRRHGPRVAAFGGAVRHDPLRVQDAADRAMDRYFGMLAAASGAPDRPPRLELLTLVSSSAPSAAGDMEPAEGSTDAHDATPDRVLRSFVRQGFATLSFRTQVILWHSVVEQESDQHVATLTGDRPDGVSDLSLRALSACRDAFLRAHLQARPTPHCPAYARMLDAAAGRADVRGNPDLTRHVDGCPGCAAALRGLVALFDDPGPWLAESLLGPSGPLHLSSRARTSGDGEDTLPLPTAPGARPKPPGARPKPPGGGRRAVDFLRKPAGRVAMGAATVMIMAAALAVAIHPTGGPKTPDTEQADPPRPPVAAGGGVMSPAPSGSRTRPSASDSPQPSRSASPSATRPSPGATPSPTPTTEAVTVDPLRPFQASAYVPAVNAATGLCLDIRGGTFSNGVDVITARCRDGAPAQQWRLDDKGLLHNAADPGYCMDARGSTRDGVGIWSCSASGRAEGENLVFSTDATGRIKPRIAPGYAVIPGSGGPGSPVTFGRAGAAAEQRWNESDGQPMPGR